jgi:hypothetical protein
MRGGRFFTGHGGGGMENTTASHVTVGAGGNFRVRFISCSCATGVFLGAGIHLSFSRAT